MEFRQLRSFVEVVRQGSFTQAAQVRHASQSTISKQVA
ncbi:LysR family transcriptional regulator, partial [Pseudomonas aeruginosa]